MSDISHAGKCHNYWSRQESDESEKLHCNDMLQLVRRLGRLHGIKGLHWIIHDDDNARNFGLGFWMRQKQVQETNIKYLYNTQRTYVNTSGNLDFKIEEERLHLIYHITI